MNKIVIFVIFIAAALVIVAITIITLFDGLDSVGEPSAIGFKYKSYGKENLVNCKE